MFPDHNYDDLPWTDIKEFQVVYDHNTKSVQDNIENWQKQGRCMLFDTNETDNTSRYLVRSNSGFYNFLITGPNGCGWQISNGISAYRLGYFIAGPTLNPQ
jgi:hypothetical protein